MINLITTDYLSPRWTGEILDCAMPMTLDSYTCCSYQCLYCFAYFQRAHNVAGYSERQVRGVDPDRIRKLFTDALLNKETTKANSQFKAYIQDRKYCQWGGMSDPFDENERKYKISLQVLRFMDEIDYPLSISTKGAWFTEDPRYMNIIKKHAHNWHFKISIISTKEEMVKKIELGVPSTQERFKAMERLASLGLEVTLRYRPYIPIMSEDYTEMLKQAKKSGAKGVTSEFFCMEARADETTKKRYKAMSNSLGFDIYQYYMKNSKVSGYKRLNEDIKRPIFTAIKRCAHSLGLQFNCSDQYCRDLNDTCNCCGAKDQWSYTGGLQSAINKAKLTGYARYKDIQPEIDKYFNFLLSAACQFNTSSTKARAKYGDFTMREYIRYCWNEQKQKSLHGYGKLFVAEGIDDDNNVIYRYIRS